MGARYAIFGAFLQRLNRFARNPQDAEQNFSKRHALEFYRKVEKVKEV
jgi:hypothetical protein